MDTEIKYYWSRAPGRFVNKLTGADPFASNGKTQKRLALKQIKEYVLDGMKPKTVVKVFQETEEEVPLASLNFGPMFSGTVREWYETLLETIHDVAKQLEEKTKCRVTQITTSPDITTILEHTIPYRARYILDSEGDPYAPRKIADNPVEEMGTLNNRYKVFKDYDQPLDEIYVQVFDPENPQKLLKQGIIKVLDLMII